MYLLDDAFSLLSALWHGLLTVPLDPIEGLKML